MNKKNDDAILVYSTAGPVGKPCKKCSQSPCRCAPESSVVPKDFTVKVRREIAGRNGKPVTVVFELPNQEKFCEKLLKDLKKSLGAGGTYKNGRIEIQGDHRDRVAEILAGQGFRVKMAGG